MDGGDGTADLVINKRFVSEAELEERRKRRGSKSHGVPPSGEVSWCVPECDTGSLSPARPKHSKALGLASQREMVRKPSEHPKLVGGFSFIACQQLWDPEGWEGCRGCCGCPALLCHHPGVKHSFSKELRVLGAQGPQAQGFLGAAAAVSYVTGKSMGGFSQADLFAPLWASKRGSL